MAMTLAEAAKFSQNDLQRGVIETIIERSPLLQLLPFESVSGNAYAYDQENTLPGAAFRAVNAGYIESTPTFTQKTVSLVILGGDADVDRFIVQTRPGEVSNLRAEVTAAKAKAVRMAFQDTFINGDTASDANAFDGLKKVLSGAQVITGGTNGIPVVGNGGTDIDTFLDAVDSLMAAVIGGPDILLMNDAILAKFKSAARRKLIYAETKDDFGRPITTYNGVPLMDVGYKSDGSTRILPQTETQGTSNVASSIYAVKFGRVPSDRGVTGLTNGGVQVYDLGEVTDKPVFRTRIEFYCAYANHGDKAAARLQGILAS